MMIGCFRPRSSNQSDPVATTSVPIPLRQAQTANGKQQAFVHHYFLGKVSRFTVSCPFFALCFFSFSISATYF